MSKHMFPYTSTLGWKQDVSNLTFGGLKGYSEGKDRDNLYSVPSKTVSLLPLIVPFQQNMLSSSGKADIPESPPIYRRAKE